MTMVQKSPQSHGLSFLKWLISIQFPDIVTLAFLDD